MLQLSLTCWLVWNYMYTSVLTVATCHRCIQIMRWLKKSKCKWEKPICRSFVFKKWSASLTFACIYSILEGGSCCCLLWADSAFAGKYTVLNFTCCVCVIVVYRRTTNKSIQEAPWGISWHHQGQQSSIHTKELETICSERTFYVDRLVLATFQSSQA